MDIIQSFLPYASMNPHKLNRYIEHHPGLTIATKYAALSDELSKARLATLGACQVTAKGGLVIESRPGMAELQSRISGLEARVGRLVEIAQEYGKVLESVGVTDPTAANEDLERGLEQLSQTAQISPACWQRFILEHNRNPLILPGDILTGDYASFEQERRSIRDKALEEIAPLREAIKKLSTLAAEAAGL